MQPLVFSVREATQGRAHWVRSGTHVSYFRNHLKRPPKPGCSTVGGIKRGQWYHTASFTMTFPHAYDVCYVAYHYPYSYTQLRVSLTILSCNAQPS